MLGLPADFADRLLPLIAPGEEQEVAAVLLRAAALDEAALSDFLAALAARVRNDAAPIRGAELRAMVGCGERPAAAPRGRAPSS